MATQYDAWGNEYNDTTHTVDDYGTIIPIDGVLTGSALDQAFQDAADVAGSVDYGAGGLTDQQVLASMGGTETPPPGAVGKDPTGTNWINSLGQIVMPVATSLAAPWLNNLQSGGLLDTASKMLTTSGTALGNVQAPDLQKLIPQLRLQVMQGQMTPAQAAAALQQASQMGTVQSDAESLQGQRAALQRLAEIGQGGMTDTDRAALAAAMNQASAKTASDRAAQLQQLQMQGNAGSGAELAARLSGIQGGANANAMAGAEAAKAAQARALQALQTNLQGNANLNTQQFEQAAQKAKAQDVVNQFNANAANAANLANAGWTQQANLNNFNTANEIAKGNTAIQNQQAMMPWNAAQANFENQLGLGKAQTASQVAAGKELGVLADQQIKRSNALGGITGGTLATGTTSGGTTSGGTTAGTRPTGGTSGSSGSGVGSLIGAGIGNAVAGPIGGAIGSAIGNNAGDIWNGITDAVSDIGSGLGDAVNSVGSWLGGLFSSDEDLKTGKRQLTDDEVDKLMAHMTAYKYRYKGDPTNPERAGVMAQDLEKGGSDSVVNTPAGKMIQPANMMSEALAVLANQHERIKKLEGK